MKEFDPKKLKLEIETKNTGYGAYGNLTITLKYGEVVCDKLTISGRDIEKIKAVDFDDY